MLALSHQGDDDLSDEIISKNKYGDLKAEKSHSKDEDQDINDINLRRCRPSGLAIFPLPAHI